ncbi:MAG: DUF4367 domain-containing protein [Bacillota bacterium]
MTKKVLLPLGVLVAAAISISLFCYAKLPFGGEPGSPGAHQYMDWQSMSDEERVAHFRDLGQIEFKDFAELQRNVDFPVLEPTNTLGRRLLGIFQPAGRPIVDVTALFENGLQICICRNETPPDYQNYLKQVAEDKVAGYWKSDGTPKIIKINGIEAICDDPGFNDIEGRKVPRPGYICWYDGGANYSIYGDKIPVSDLLAVAKSMMNNSKEGSGPKSQNNL